MSVHGGTKRTGRDVRAESAFGGKSGSLIPGPGRPLLTHRWGNRPAQLVDS
jgi:hypothetical protein